MMLQIWSFYSSIDFTTVKAFAVMLNRNMTHMMLVIPLLYHTCQHRRLENREQSSSKGKTNKFYYQGDQKTLFRIQKRNMKDTQWSRAPGFAVFTPNELLTVSVKFIQNPEIHGFYRPTHYREEGL